MNFWHGQAVLRRDGSEVALDTRVFLDEDFDLKIETLDYFDLEVFFRGASENITCEIPGVAQPTGYF
jgi:hypothetical protein